MKDFICIFATQKNHTKLNSYFLLNFRLEVPTKLVKATYVAATKLRMSSAAKQCGNYLVENMTPDNCIGMYKSELMKIF